MRNYWCVGSLISESFSYFSLVSIFTLILVASNKWISILWIMIQINWQLPTITFILHRLAHKTRYDSELFTSLECDKFIAMRKKWIVCKIAKTDETWKRYCECARKPNSNLRRYRCWFPVTKWVIFQYVCILIFGAAWCGVFHGAKKKSWNSIYRLCHPSWQWGRILYKIAFNAAAVRYILYTEHKYSSNIGALYMSSLVIFVLRKCMSTNCTYATVTPNEWKRFPY